MQGTIFWDEAYHIKFEDGQYLCIGGKDLDRYFSPRDARRIAKLRGTEDKLKFRVLRLELT